MAGDGASIRIHQNWIVETKLRDARYDLGNLSLRVRGFYAYGTSLSSGQCSIDCAVTFDGVAGIAAINSNCQFQSSTDNRVSSQTRRIHFSCQDCENCESGNGVPRRFQLRSEDWVYCEGQTCFWNRAGARLSAQNVRFDVGFGRLRDMYRPFRVNDSYPKCRECRV
jgi:hypothetical protein